MFLSFNRELSLVTVVFFSLLKCMNCDCGPPGIPYLAKVYPQNKTSFSEKSEIRYECEGGTDIFYKANRICREGKWTGRVPKCGNY
jgi:hypothetical protein